MRSATEVRPQALALVVLLVPLAGLGAAGLAHVGGAAQPLHAALLTWGLATAGGLIILQALERMNYPHSRLGVCNIMTLLRAAAITMLAGLLATPEVLHPETGLGWALVVLAVITLMLDGVDGWAARRSGLRSEFGARFDMEADVGFAIVMAALAWQSGQVGIWFLALGLLRPAFLLAALLLPALRHPLPDAYWRKSIAAVQMGVQVAILTPIIAPTVAQLLGASLLLGVALGFAVDIRWLLTRAQRDACAAQA